MTKYMLSAPTAAFLALTGTAFAMSGAAIEIDADGDGILSVAEVQAIYPEVTAAQFSEMDLNADGALDDAEVKAAQAAGKMPVAPSEG